MEIRIQHIFLKLATLFSCTVFCLLLALPSIAAEGADETDSPDDLGGIFDPKVERREVSRDAIDSENWEIGLYYGVISVEDFGASEIKGLRVAYHVTEDFFIESSYAQTRAGLSSFERLNGNVVLLTDSQRKYSHYNISLGFNILPGEGFVGDNTAFSSQLYFLTGLGSTNFAGEQRSTIMIGGGYRVLFTDWFAAHLTLKDHLYDIELLGSAKTASDLEISTTFSFYF